jgi:hypothetical protein
MDDEFGGSDIGNDTSFDSGGDMDVGFDDGGAFLGDIPEDTLATVDPVDSVAMESEQIFDDIPEDTSSIVEPGAEISHGEFLEAQDEFEESIMDGTVYNDDIEPDAEMTHGEFLEEQTRFEEEIMGEREPGAELSHDEFLDAQNQFEAEVRDDVDWPENGGSVEGTEHEVDLHIGDEITRREHSGHPNLDGSYAGTDDISFEESSLPGEEEDYDTHHLEVAEELPDDYTVTAGEVAPAFGREGGGEQIHITRENWLNPDAAPLDVPLQDLKDYGYLEGSSADEEQPPNDEGDE